MKDLLARLYKIRLTIITLFFAYALTSLFPKPELQGVWYALPFVITLTSGALSTFIGSAIFLMYDKRKKLNRSILLISTSILAIVAMIIWIYCLSRRDAFNSGEPSIYLPLVLVFLGTLLAQTSAMLIGLTNKWIIS